jgi:hypothetical protein
MIRRWRWRGAGVAGCSQSQAAQQGPCRRAGDLWAPARGRWPRGAHPRRLEALLRAQALIQPKPRLRSRASQTFSRCAARGMAKGAPGRGRRAGAGAMVTRAMRLAGLGARRCAVPTSSCSGRRRGALPAPAQRPSSVACSAASGAGPRLALSRRAALGERELRSAQRQRQPASRRWPRIHSAGAAAGGLPCIRRTLRPSTSASAPHAAAAEIINRRRRCPSASLLSRRSAILPTTTTPTSLSPTHPPHTMSANPNAKNAGT